MSDSQIYIEKDNLEFQKILNELNKRDEKTVDIQDNEKLFGISSDHCHLFRINEIAAQEQFFLRQDLENVFASLSILDCNLIYIISGKPKGIEIYIGVLNKQGKLTHNDSDFLKNQLQGNISGIEISKVTREDFENNLLASLENSIHFGLVSGIPSLTIDIQAQNQGKSISQGLDRLAKTLLDDEWQIVLVAQPLERESVQKYIENIIQFSTDISPFIKSTRQISNNGSTNETITNGQTKSNNKSTQITKSISVTKEKGNNIQTATQKGKSASKNIINSSQNTTTGDNSNESTTNIETNGNSTTTAESKNETETNSINDNNSIANGVAKGYSQGESSESINREIERLESYISENQIKRYELGLGKGLFNTAIYLCTKRLTAYKRLSSAFQAVFQGNQNLYNPLFVQKINIKNDKLETLFNIHYSSTNMSVEKSLIKSCKLNSLNKPAHATLLNSSEIALLAGLPSKEVCGIRLRKNVDFSVNPLKPEGLGIELGKIILNGRQLANANLCLDKNLLKQHVFISGVTGAGKTTTCQQLLIASELPFLVIEPAKTEYRTLYKIDKDIQFYTLNNESVSPFRLNPFEFLQGEHLLSHIDTLKATFAAVFPMEASMPYLIEEAIVKSYETKGWDIHTSQNYFYSNPWQSNGECFPIMSEMLIELEEVIESKKFGQELQEKYRGSLISRLDNLTIGSKGRMLNTRRSINIIDLMNQKVVIELEELKDEQDKALIMGLLIGRIAEAAKYLHKQNNNFRHLTLIEEAHRLLEKADGNNERAKKLGINLFANLLAEVRKYGEGLIIADQIPNKLAVEVLKNTNTKIIHRLFASDDRRAMGETIGLQDEQINFLPMLKAGEAVIYSAGWHEAVRIQVKMINNTSAQVIDEAIIKEHSKKRIFYQRHRLYPLLSKIWQENDKDKFQDFLLEGSIILNIWIKWYHLQHSKKQYQKILLIEQMKIKLKEFYQRWQFLDNTDLALAYLFLDTAPIIYLESKTGSKPMQEYLVLLFSLFHKNYLDKTIPYDNVFNVGEDQGRLVQKTISQLFDGLNSI